MMKIFILGLWIFSASQARATFSTLTATTNTGVLPSYQPTGSSAPTYYYSNISATAAPVTYNGIQYNSDGGGNTGCPNAYNQNCHNNSDVVSFTAFSNSTTGGTLYVIVSATQITTASNSGQPLSGAYTLTQQSYVAGETSQAAMSFSFAQICAKAVAGITAAGGVSTTNIGGTVVGINPDCTLGNGTVGPNVATFITGGAQGPLTAVELFINFVLETDGSGQLTAADIGTIPLFIASAIPAYSTLSSSIGFYGWLAFPGDGEIEIKNITTDTAFPATENGTIGVQNVLFYYNTTGFNGSPALNPTGGAPTQALAVVGNTTALSSYYITGLSDGVKYYLAAAEEDYAGNIGFLTNPSTDNIPAHATTPDQIVGLLSKNGECFIATAAYGTPMATQVQTLRSFRDRFLMKSQWGRNFVSFYYKHSPAIAKKNCRP